MNKLLNVPLKAYQQQSHKRKREKKSFCTNILNKDDKEALAKCPWRNYIYI